MEGEALAVEPGAHQSEQDRRWADQWRDANPERMRARHQAGTGIGHRRAAGVRHQADVLARERRGEQGVERRSGAGAVSGQFLDVGFAQRVRVVELLQVRAGGTRGLDHEPTQSGRDRLCLGGQEGRPRRGFAERDRDEVERAAGVALRGVGRGFAHGSSSPSARNMRDRAISGRPISAVGSSPGMASSRVMPRPSDFALPAQSSGCSFAT